MVAALADLSRLVDLADRDSFPLDYQELRVSKVLSVMIGVMQLLMRFDDSTGCSGHSCLQAHRCGSTSGRGCPARHCYGSQTSALRPRRQARWPRGDESYRLLGYTGGLSVEESADHQAECDLAGTRMGRDAQGYHEQRAAVRILQSRP